MDINEISAMTEASGLTNGLEQTADARPRADQSPSQDAALVWAARLRKVTVKARCNRSPSRSCSECRSPGGAD
jgi:hypothetical protein